MILPGLFALLTAVGPLLRGCWDVRAQSLLHLTLVVGLCAWIVSRVAVGYIPLPSRRVLLWSGLLAVLGAASVWTSPVHGLTLAPWGAGLGALWMFPAMAALSKDQRASVDQAIRAGGWVLLALAFYQHFALGDERPASALLNQNAYAGAVLLLLPLAAERRDWLLALGLVWTLWWTRSVGAWLGLSVALALTQRRRRPFLFWSGGAVALVCAVAIYGKLGTPEVLHRWWWWKAAAAMAMDRPFLGYGPGAFAYVLPAYLPARSGGLYSLYAHNYPLETLAEYGIPFALLWFAGLWRCLTRIGSHKGFGVLAALIQSLWDYPLSIPSNLWLFAYFAASSIPDSAEGINVPARRKLPAALTAAGLGWMLCGRVIDGWRGYRLTGLAVESLEAGDLDAATARLSRARSLRPQDPEVPMLAAALEIRRARSSTAAAARGAWSQAAAHLERAVRLNPYRASLWTELALAYRRLGRPEDAEAVLRRSRRYQAQ